MADKPDYEYNLDNLPDKVSNAPGDYDLSNLPDRNTEISFDDAVFMTTGLQSKDYPALQKTLQEQSKNPPDLSVMDLILKGYDASVAGAIAQATSEKPNAALLEATPEEVEKIPVEFRSLSAEEYKNLPWWQRQVMGATTLMLDFPVMVAGGLLGAAAGAATGPGVVITTTAGAFALPKGLRKVYVDRVRNGSVDSWGEFWDRLSGGVMETAKGWGTGAATGAVSVVAGPIAGPAVSTATKVFGPKVGVSTGQFVADVGKLAAEGSTMVTVGALLDGRVPEPYEFTDVAITLGAMKLVSKGGPKLVETIRTSKDAKATVNNEQVYSVREKLLMAYKETGIPPKDILELAAKDRKFFEEFTADTAELPAILAEKIKSGELLDRRAADEAKIKELDDAIKTQTDLRNKDIENRLKTTDDATAMALEDSIRLRSVAIDRLMSEYNETIGRSSKIEMMSKDMEAELTRLEYEIDRQQNIVEKNNAEANTLATLGQSASTEYKNAINKADAAAASVVELRKRAGYLKGQRERIGTIPSDAEYVDYGKRLTKMAKEELGLDVLEAPSVALEKVRKYAAPEVETIWGKTKDVLTKGWHLITRQFEFLPAGEYGDLKFKLTQWQKTRDIINEKVGVYLKYIVEGLDKESYKLFNDKIVLTDMATEYNRKLASRQPGDTTKPKLPEDLTIQQVLDDIAKTDVAIEKSPQRDLINTALRRRRDVWTNVRADYIEALNEIGYTLKQRSVLEDYFKHKVAEYTNELSRSTGKAYKKPKPGEKPYYTDYLYVENSVLAQLLHDIETANLIRFLKKEYSDPRKLNLESAAKEKEGTTWRDFVDTEKEAVWSPRKGSGFYIAESMVDKNLGYFLKKLLNVDDVAFDKLMESPTIKDIVSGLMDDSRHVTLSSKREEYVLPKAIVDTLEKLSRPTTDNLPAKLLSAPTTLWKKWVLFGPNVVKYTARNLTGDLDIVIAGNPRILFTPSGVMKLIKSAEDIAKYYSSEGPAKMVEGKMPEFKEWMDRGGHLTTIQAQEKIGELNKAKDMLKKMTDDPAGLTEKAWNKYWKTVRIANDIRESWLRYANFLDYRESMLRDIDSGGKGIPHNFGASRKADILQISDISDRAFALSNDLLGAYDRITEAGQALRAYAYPFWSFKEINMRRYTNLMRNAATAPEIVEKYGEQVKATYANKVAKIALMTPLATFRLGATILKVQALSMALALYNQLFYGDEEKLVPEEVRKRPHVILPFGDKEKGEVSYFTRIGSFSDLLDWVGMANAPDLAVRLLRGEISQDEFVEKYAGKYLPSGEVDVQWTTAAKNAVDSASKTAFNDAFPLIKIAYGAYEKLEFYPTLRKSRETSTVGVIAKNLGAYNAYKRVANLFVEDKYPMKEAGWDDPKAWGDWFVKQAFYKSDTFETAYFDILSKKDKYLSDNGKGGFNGRIDPKSQFLYNAKVAIKVGDDAMVEHYMRKYFEVGGTKEGLKRSLSSLSPLYGLSKQELAGFINTLNEDDQIKFEMALIYYTSLIGE